MSLIGQDIQEFAGGSSVRKKFSLIINPCFHAVALYRISSFLYRYGLLPFAKIVWYVNRLLFNVDIDCRAKLAGGFVLVHGLGVVIGKDVESMGPLKVYQGVTLGGNGKSKIDNNGREYWQPILGKNVTIYANAIVLGPVMIRDNAVVKAGRMVLQDV